jgi:hypothetical protein
LTQGTLQMHYKISPSIFVWFFYYTSKTRWVIGNLCNHMSTEVNSWRHNEGIWNIIYWCKPPNSIISFVPKNKSIEHWKKLVFLAILLVLQTFSRTYQILLNKVNEDIYRPLWYVWVFIVGKFSGISVFEGLERGIWKQ